MTVRKKYRRREAWEISERRENLRKRMEQHGIARGTELFNEEEEDERLPPATPEEFRNALAELILMELKQHSMGSPEQFLQTLGNAVEIERGIRNLIRGAQKAAPAKRQP
jgi:hypothetical protein